MQVYRLPFGDLLRKPATAPVALTIGNFDSVHRGHLGLIDRLKHQARQRGMQSAVLTFEPHPREFLTPHAAPLRLSSLRDKLSQLRSSGVDQVYVARFDRQLANLNADDFIRQVLVDRIGAGHVMIGDDFHFGRLRQGNIQLLKSMGSEHGFDVAAMDTLRFDEERISSSRVRAALARGDTPLAEQLLGRRYALSCRLAGIQHAGHLLTLSLRLTQPSLAVGGCHEVVLSDAQGHTLSGLAYASPRPVHADGVLSLRVDVPVPSSAMTWLAGTRLEISFRRRHQPAIVETAADDFQQQGQPG